MGFQTVKVELNSINACKNEKADIAPKHLLIDKIADNGIQDNSEKNYNNIQARYENSHKDFKFQRMSKSDEKEPINNLIDQHWIQHIEYNDFIKKSFLNKKSEEDKIKKIEKELLTLQIERDQV